MLHYWGYLTFEISQCSIPLMLNSREGTSGKKMGKKQHHCFEILKFPFYCEDGITSLL